MKALRFYAPEDVRVEDVPEPECGPREVKIKVRNCSTCGTDVKIKKNGHVNITRVTTMGHEVAGEVVEVGAEALGGFEVGDRVQCIAAVPCGECHECRKGWMAVCQNQTSVGYQYDGGFAEYMIVPEQVLKVDGLNRIPDNVGYDEASAAEPFACAINAQELLGIEEGDTVVVFGAGPIGCMAAAISRHVGARRVVVTDVNPWRLELAIKLGATHTIDVTKDSVKAFIEREGMKGFDIGLEMSGSGAAFESMLEGMYPGGRIALLGILPPETRIDWDQVIFKGLHLKGIYGREIFETWYKMQAMLLSGLNIAPIITHRLPFDQYQKGFDAMLSGQSGKVILTLD